MELVERPLISVTTLIFDVKMSIVPNDCDFIEFKHKKGFGRLPVIRVFGSTPGGQRTCVHIHGFLPYFYFRPKNPQDCMKLFSNIADVKNQLAKFMHDLETALRIHYAQEHKFTNNNSYIHTMEVCMKKSIYGYEKDPSPFVKVYLYNPYVMKTCVEKMEAGQICNLPMQTFESHIPYLLQFTLQYRIRPTDWIHLDNVRFRGPMPLSNGRFPPPSQASSAASFTPSSQLKSTEASRESDPNSRSIYITHTNASSVSPLDSPLMEKHDDRRLHVFDASNTAEALIWNLGSSDDQGIDLIGTQDIFTQDENEVWKGSMRNDKDRCRNGETRHPLARETTCDLELDVNVSQILNQHKEIETFGGELWKAETLRRKRRGEGPDVIQTPPFTESHQLPLQSISLEMQDRYNALREIGAKAALDSKCDLPKSWPKSDIEARLEALSSDSESGSEEFLKSSQEDLPNGALRLSASQYDEKSESEEDSDCDSFEDPRLALTQMNEALEPNVRERVYEKEKENENEMRHYLKHQNRPRGRERGSLGSVFSDKNKLDDRIKNVDDETHQRKRLRGAQPMPRPSPSSPHSTLTSLRNSAPIPEKRHGPINGITDGSPLRTFSQGTQCSTPTVKTASKTLNVCDNDAHGRDCGGDCEIGGLLTPPRANRMEDERLFDSGYMKEKDSDEERCAKSLLSSEGSLSMQSPHAFSSDAEALRETALSMDYLSENQLQENTMEKTRLRRLDSFTPTNYTNPSLSSTKILRESESDDDSDYKVQNDDDLLINDIDRDVDQGSKNLGRTYPNNIESAELKAPKCALISSDRKSRYSIHNLIRKECLLLVPDLSPPRPSSLASFASLGLDNVVNVRAHYSDVKSEPKGVSNAYFKEHLAHRAITSKSKKYFNTRVLPSTDNVYTKAVPHSSVDFREGNRERDADEGALAFLKGCPNVVWLCPVCTLENIAVNAMYACAVCKSPRTRYFINNSDGLGESHASGVGHIANSEYLGVTRPKREGIAHDSIVLMPAFSPLTRSEVMAAFQDLSKASIPVNSTDVGHKQAEAGLFSTPCDSNRAPLAHWQREIQKGGVLQRRDSQITTPSGKSPGLGSQAMGMKMSVKRVGEKKTGKKKPAIACKAEEKPLTKMKHTAHSNIFVSNEGDKGAENPVWSSRYVTMSIEIHCQSRGSLLPDPRFDRVECIVGIIDDMMLSDEEEAIRRHHWAVLLLRDDISPEQMNVVLAAAKESDLVPKCATVETVTREDRLFKAFVDKVRMVDPDFLMGYEVQYKSLGYLIDRCKELELPDLCRELGRLPWEKPFDKNEIDDGWAADHESGVFASGRIVINLWRRMRSDLKLHNYSVQNVATHLLQKNVPHFSQEQIHVWFSELPTMHRALRHIFRMAALNLDLLNKQDLIRRTSESARLYGIDFFSTLTRGSQYRVEAAMLRTAHPAGFICISPTAKAVAEMDPIVHIPLVMEPKSNFYYNPVVVLDFQSLYPSIVISYNLCFSTLQGRLRAGSTRDDGVHTVESLGVLRQYPQAVSAAHVHDEEGRTYIAPNGAMFCPASTRKGILPKMLKEMLSTRQMIKRAMKSSSSATSASQVVLNRVLDAQQFAIKMLANVTYGYCAASFSGRMPCVDLADAIVSTGRAILEWAMDVVKKDSAKKWGPLEIRYGDTDSMFIELMGRTKEEAFLIGKDIAATITALCPEDIVLKFEKVYMGSILHRKKHYCGNMFESEAGDGIFEGKGIETARRDQCLATVKIQEKALMILFNTRDLTLVRRYLETQWGRILRGRVPLKDFIFSKEVTLGKYHAGSEPPGALVAMKARDRDPRDLPPQRWRVPYVAVWRGPRSPIRDLAVSPLEMLVRGSNLTINSKYYIEKQINPALMRLLELAGADVDQWYNEWPRPSAPIRRVVYPGEREIALKPSFRKDASNRTFLHRHYNMHGNDSQQNITMQLQTTMDIFVKGGKCFICEQNYVSDRHPSLCDRCLFEKDKTIMALTTRLRMAQAEEMLHAEHCRSCSGFQQGADLMNRNAIIGKDACLSINCKFFYDRYHSVNKIDHIEQAIEELSL